MSGASVCLRHAADRVGISAERVALDAVLPLHRRDENRRRPALTHRGDERRQVGRVGFQRIGRLRFHVVVAELDRDPIARPQQAVELLEPPLAQSTANRLAGLRVVRHRDAGAEEPRQHLPPTVPRRDGLVGDGRVADEEQRRAIVDAIDEQLLDARPVARERDREPVVPVGPLVGALAILEPHFAVVANSRRADADRRGKPTASPAGTGRRSASSRRTSA